MLFDESIYQIPTKLLFCIINHFWTIKPQLYSMYVAQDQFGEFLVYLWSLWKTVEYHSIDLLKKRPVEVCRVIPETDLSLPKIYYSKWGQSNMKVISFSLKSNLFLILR